MPAGQPFTYLCRAAARPGCAGRADLHIHSTSSDGQYTPAQIVELARRSGLSAIALTDHDTSAGVAAARQAAEGQPVQVIAGVEITAEFRGREIHLLGYFFDPQDAGLCAAFERLCRRRAERFQEMVDRLAGCGVRLEELPTNTVAASLGRRHLAELLVQARRAGSVQEAFSRYLGDRGRAFVPKERLEVSEAIALLHAAGGVSAWAHPPAEGADESARALATLGLDALEVEYPGRRPGQTRRQRELACSLGLAVSGGSDCHGPEPAHRAIGCRSISVAELHELRTRALARVC